MRDPEAHEWPFILAMFVGLGCLLTLSCCAHQARVYPNKYVSSCISCTFDVDSEAETN